MAGPNFIFEENNKIRATNFSPTTYYNIEELNFYISTHFGAQVQVFLILQNTNKLYEIVELKRAGVQGQSILYKLPINQILRVNNEQVSMSLMVLDYNNSLYYYSRPVTMCITTEHYELARQVYIAKEVGSVVQSCYAQILDLTAKNQNIYNILQERED